MFKSSHPNHLKQGLNGFPLGPFLLWVTPWVTNERQIGLNSPLPVIEWFHCLPLGGDNEGIIMKSFILFVVALLLITASLAKSSPINCREDAEEIPHKYEDSCVHESNACPRA